jgi:hypothetical protein
MNLETFKEMVGNRFPISYADRTQAREDGYVPVPGYSGNQPYQSDANPNAYVDLGVIAEGVDTVDQTSTLDRSNFRSLMRDYPDTFVPIAYLNVELLGAFVEDLDEDMVALLLGLANEYPVYDEEDMSAIESDEIHASIRQYALYDVKEYLPDVWDELSEDERADLFEYALRVTDYYPDHDGRDVLWCYAEVAPTLTAILLSARAMNAWDL